MNLSLSHRLALCVLVLAVALPAQCPPTGGSWGPPPPPPRDAPAGPSGPTAPEPSTPSGPTTPGPTGPSAPQPAGPSTPRGPMAGPATPRGPGGSKSGGPTTGRRGAPISFERQATSKDRLKVDWNFPVAKPRAESGTVAAGPLPLADALALLWEGGDERPLLVLRECNLCKGGDDAMLSSSLANDRTQLLSKWFRMVRLPAHVTEKSHPLHNVFAGFNFENSLPHFFLLAHPTAKPVAFSGQQLQSELWKGMVNVLEQRYVKDPLKAVREWMSLLERFDMLDARRLQLTEQLSEVRATDGPSSERAKKIGADLQRNDEDRAEAVAREKRVRDLGLVKMPSAALATAAGK